MKILVTSDSHGCPKVLEKIIDSEEDVSTLIFCGDGEADFSIIRSKFPNIDFYIVRGNSDYNSKLTLKHEIKLSGVKIMVTHGHEFYVKSGLGKLQDYAEAKAHDIVCYGHTHMQKCDYSNGIYYINPGASSLYFEEYAVIEIENNEINVKLKSLLKRKH